MAYKTTATSVGLEYGGVPIEEVLYRFRSSIPAR